MFCSKTIVKVLLLIIFIASLALCSNSSLFDDRQMLKQDEEVLMNKFTLEFKNFAEHGYKSEEFNRIVEKIKINGKSRRVHDDDENSGPSRRALPSTKCLACRSGLSYLLWRRRQGDSQDSLENVAIAVCKVLTFYSQEVCSGIVKLNMDSIIFIIDQRQTLTANSICAMILQDECGDLEKFLDFQLNVSSSSPIAESKAITTNSNKIKILHISDIHYDPQYQVGGKTKCDAPCCCRVKQGNAIFAFNKAGYWGDYRDCDIPWHTVENAIKSAASQHPDVDFVYYTGDLVDHGIWETTKSGNVAIMDKIYSLFKEVFGSKKVYSILGNHEAQPLNVFAPSSIKQDHMSSQWLYDHAATAWSYWLPNDNLDTVRKGGYYTTLVQPGLRLIALNNNDCYIYNWWILYSIDDVIEQLQWLHDTLLAAEQKNEKVHILVHIASGEGSCFSYWSREYRRVIERFHNTISAQFNGHSHYNEFNIFYDRNNINNAINVAWNGGSVTTFTNLNPNYNVYWIDDEIFQVNDVETWIFNLTETNLTPESNPRWFKQYSFKETFNVPNLSPASLNKFLTSMTIDKNLAKKYFEIKMKAADPLLKKGCDDNCLRNHICEISTNEVGDNRKCLELMQNSFTSNDSSNYDIEQVLKQEECWLPSKKCLGCKTGLSYLFWRGKKGDSKKSLEKTAISVCKVLTTYSQEVCAGIIKLNIDSFIYIIQKRPYITANSICALILQGECGVPDLFLDFQLNISPAKPISESKTITSNSNKIKILHISDIHYDPQYQVGGKTKCDAPCCCRVKQGIAEKKSEGAGYWGDYRDCDIPWHTVENAIKSAASQHPDTDFVYYTGDFVDHGIWETSVRGNIEIMDKIYALFREVFGNKTVYSVLGNHEAQPVNIFAPSSIKQDNMSSQWLYDHAATAWSYWLPNDNLDTVRKGGYYTTLVQPGLRLIALNNNDCYIYNWWILYSIDDVVEQLQWLHDTLLAAEQNNEKVHILVHIASGEGSCFSYWSREYRRVVERFHKTISAQFNGHSHFNEFNIFYDRNNINHAINVAWNGGSVTTFTNLNPNYNVYWIDDEIFQVNEVEAWIFNLTEANLTPESSPRWFKQYSFKETFNVPDLSPASLNKFLTSMSIDKSLAKKYFEIKMKAADPLLKKGCDDNCLRNHICEISKNEVGDNRKCSKLKEIFSKSNDVYLFSD